MRSPSTEPSCDAGAILLATLMVMLAMLGAGMSLLLVTDVDVIASANVRDQLDVRASSEAALEFGMAELARAPDWSLVLSGGAGVFFGGGFRMPPTAGGAPVDAGALTADAQRSTYPAAAWAGDTPQWRLVGHGIPGLDLPGSGLSTRVYVLLWISDDVADQDGNVWADANDRVVLRAQALGPRGTRAVVQAVVGRTAAPGVVRRIGWRRIE